MDEEDATGTVAHILTGKPRQVLTIQRDATIRNAIGMMKEHGISQIPVLDESGRHCGLVSEIDLLNYLVENPKSVESSIADLVEGNYATVTPHTRIQLLRNIFNDAKVVLVIENDELKGLLTKIDLIDFIADQPLSKG